MSSTRRTMTRRDSLLAAGAGGLSLYLAACGSNSDGGAESAQVSKKTPLEDQVNVQIWGGYADFALPKFEDAEGVSVKSGFYGSDDEAIAKMRSAASGQFDLYFHGTNFIPKLIGLDLIQPWNQELITNFDQLYPELQKAPFHPAPGETYTELYQIPFAWGITGLTIRTDDVSPAPTSWGQLGDAKYKDRIALQDSPSVRYFLGALALDIDPAEESGANVDKVKSYLKDSVMPNVRTLWSTGDDVVKAMGSGEVALGDLWDNLTAQLVTDGKPVELLVPEEGVQGFIDGPILLKGAKHPAAAHAFANFVISKPIQVQSAVDRGNRPTNEEAAAALPPKQKETLQVAKAEALISELKQLPNWGADFSKEINQMWIEVKG